MTGTSKEVHLIAATIHKLVVNGVDLIEERTITTVTSEDSGKVLEEKSHRERRIGSTIQVDQEDRGGQQREGRGQETVQLPVQEVLEADPGP